MGCNCDNCGGVVTGLHHIGVHVRDAKISEKFYVELLGFEKTAEFHNGPTTLVFVKAGSCVIELIENADKTERPKGVIDHVALQVKDIESLVCRLIEKQIVFDTMDIQVNPWLFGGAKNIFFKGPDGERIEFFEVPEV
ncbi:MAG: VOC family protein [Clostridia bacterium]|nr:VOC family protein [Clostridia bacterium]